MSIFRALPATIALLCLALAPSALATELLAKADTRMPAATMYKPADIESVAKGFLAVDVQNKLVTRWGSIKAGHIGR